MARILIVDDSPSQLMGIRRIVEKLGHDALTAEDGAAGVDAAKREIPDLILMDVVMPRKNGFEALRELRTHDTTRETPVILVTTRGEPTNVEEGYAAGCSDFVTKPIEPEELLTKVRSCLGC